MTQLLFRQCLAFVSDVLLSLFFFRALPPQILSVWKRIGLTLGGCLFLVPIYFRSGQSYAVVSFLLRGMFGAVLLCQKALLPRARAFSTLYYVVCHTAVQNIFLVPFFSSIHLGTVMFLENVYWNTVLCILIRFAIFAGLFALVSTTLSQDMEIELDIMQLGILGPLILSELYVKNTLSTISGLSGKQPAVVSSYPILLETLLLAFVVLFEWNMNNLRIRQELQVQSILNCYRLRDMEARSRAAADIRSLHHDMKNHLLVLRQLIHSGELPRADDYISNLLSGFSSFEIQYKTGNSMLDALLSAKASEARQKDVPLSVSMDCTALPYMKDSDLCTILGNVLDNAIEACVKLPEPSERFITLQTQCVANQLLIILRNSFAEPLQQQNGLLATTKDPASHGIGLKNVKRTLEKYGGTLSFETESGHIFSLNIMLPRNVSSRQNESQITQKQ